MSDVQYQGTDAEQPAPIETDVRVLDPIPQETPGDELTIEEATSEVRGRREPWDSHDLPIVERQAYDQDKTLTLKEASKQLSDAHRREWGHDMLTASRALLNSRKVVTDAELREFDQEAHAAGVQMGMPTKPSEPSWNPTGLLSDEGKILPPLGR